MSALLGLLEEENLAPLLNLEKVSKTSPVQRKSDDPNRNYLGSYSSGGQKKNAASYDDVDSSLKPTYQSSKISYAREELSASYPNNSVDILPEPTYQRLKKSPVQRKSDDPNRNYLGAYSSGWQKKKAASYDDDVDSSLKPTYQENNIKNNLNISLENQAGGEELKEASLLKSSDFEESKTAIEENVKKVRRVLGVNEYRVDYGDKRQRIGDKGDIKRAQIKPIEYTNSFTQKPKKPRNR